MICSDDIDITSFVLLQVVKDISAHIVDSTIAGQRHS